MPLTTAERLALVRQADAVWGGLWAAFGALTDEQIDRPNTVGTWCARDVMVHIANWEERLVEVMRAKDAGQPLPQSSFEGDALDEWNEAHVAPLRQVSLDDARAYILRCHLDLLGLVLTSPSIRPDWVLGTYPGHLDDLLAMVGG